MIDLRADVIILGAGIAGASLAYALSDNLRVLLIEREHLAGYHSTGRSAAMLIETYGSKAVRHLTRMSRSFFERPPKGFADLPLLTSRGYLRVARADQRDHVDRAYDEGRAALPAMQRLDQREVCKVAPLVDPAYVDCGLYEPDAKAIDVAALHQGFLKSVRQHGGHLITDATIEKNVRTTAGWRLNLSSGVVEAEVLVDAGGAWADEIAVSAGIKPIGLQPKRRTAILLEPPEAADISNWPMVADIDYRFYVKPEGQQLMVSPADETPVPPSDVQPEELDVAIAVDRYQTLTAKPVTTIGRRWAGLRSLVGDNDPVVGFDTDEPGFFWLAGLGGFGIMTAPGIAKLASALIMKQDLSDEHLRLARSLSPARLRPA